MDRITIDLPDELADLLHDAVASGAYASETEVITSALKTWSERDLYAPGAVERLRELVDAGLAEGGVEPWDSADIRRTLADRNKG